MWDDGFARGRPLHHVESELGRQGLVHFGLDTRTRRRQIEKKTINLDQTLELLEPGSDDTEVRKTCDLSSLRDSGRLLRAADTPESVAKDAGHTQAGITSEKRHRTETPVSELMRDDQRVGTEHPTDAEDHLDAIEGVLGLSPITFLHPRGNDPSRCESSTRLGSRSLDTVHPEAVRDDAGPPR